MSEPPRKKVRCAMEEGPDIASAPVVVYVGESKEKFYIHETLLRASSGFFDTALKKEWAEGQDREIQLPEAEVHIFKIWVKWLYTGRLFLTMEGDVSYLEDGEFLGSDEWARWSLAYAMGDFFQDCDFKDAAIDALTDGMIDSGRYPFRLAKCVYTHSPYQSAHRKLAVDLFVYVWRRGLLARDMEHPQQFIMDVFSVIAPGLAHGIKSKSMKDLLVGSAACKYHDHGPDKPCYKTKPAFRF